MKKLLLAASLCLFLSGVNAQTSTIYLETFESSATALPSGWVSNPSATAWQISSSNNSTGYTAAGGGNNLKIDNTISSTGVYSISTRSISTVGYSSITISWGARLTTNFPPSNISPMLYYSTNNGSTWSSVSYTEASSASAWKLNGPIAIPAAANGQSTVMFQLIANITAAASGTYRMDDFLVQGVSSGTTATAIKTNVAPQQLESYVYDKTLSFKVKSQTMVNAIHIYEITGKEVMSRTFIGETENTISLSDFINGIYVVKFELSNGQSVTKKVILF